MRIYGDAVYQEHEKVILEGNNHTTVRIPVLIRIGEFALWLKYNPAKTLIDYIGEHTWFSERYCQNDSGNVSKKCIDHGHALILLDGLDEIPEVRRRKEIVQLIREFIHQYVNAPDFISAFDEKLFDDVRFFLCRMVETQPSAKSGGSQILITSRIVGYDMNSLIGPFITHYLLSLMMYGEVNEFAKKWMSEVEQVVDEVLSNEGISIDKQTIETLSKRRIEAVKSIFENTKEYLLFNSSLLTLICTLIFQSSTEFHPKSRVEIYNQVDESALRFWIKHEPSISTELLTQFLINLSTHLHLESPSGLIDTFDITQLSRLTVKQQIMATNGAGIRRYGEKLLKALESNTGIVAERGLEVFGFQHLSFQEYFVAQSLVKRDFRDRNIIKYYSIEEIANRILLNTINPRFREPLLMGLGWISWKWLVADFNEFCTLLIRSNKNYVIPLGVLLFFDALNDMRRLPSELVIFTALDSLLDHPLNDVAKRYLIPNLFKLSEDIIKNWMSSHLKDDKSLSKFCQCFLMQFEYLFGLQSFHQKSKLSVVVAEQLWSFYNERKSAKFVVDQTLRTIMMLRRAPDNIFPNRWTSHFEPQKIDLSNIHPLILSIIIVVCGGVILEEDIPIKIHWSHRRIYRESSIMELIIEYLMNQEQSHSIKVQALIKQYEKVIEEASPSNTSDDIVDTFVALICLQEVSNLLVIRKYLRYQALLMAFEKIKQAYFFITRTFYTISNDVY
ncbi:unnamed protein product [Rotaria sordida]|uniref:NACHT domain-containing protein n=1 Tax=Rotaria sordida TaxID=392033 RepID=A0A814VE22_9BILA|nr:unnamed protein product [Rotaria sordida]CAF3874620.1 unnamed protein product [Rotaria sordida]